MKAGRIGILAAFAALAWLGSAGEALAWKVAPTHDWTVRVGKATVGVREWKEPDYTAFSASSPVLTFVTRTELIAGDFRYNVPFRIEIVASSLGTVVLLVLVGFGAGFHQVRVAQHEGADPA